MRISDWSSDVCSSDLRVDLQTYETGWRKNIANGGGNAKVAVTDLRIQIDPTGDAAVATYILEVTPRVKGEPQTTVERNQETDVLFKRDGQWQVVHRSEEHTSELQSLMRNSNAV